MEAEVERDTAVNKDIEETNEHVDLNLADVVELATVPGIGPTLASRIIAYREEHGPFLLPEEVTAVSGIGSSTYQEMREHVRATLPEELPPPDREAKEETMTESEMEQEKEREEAPLVTPPASQSEEEPTEEETVAEAEGAAPEETAAAPEEEPVAEQPEPQPEFERALPPPEPEPSPEPSTAPPPQERPFLNRRLWITGTLAAFVGGLLGMLFALLVFAGLNGSLDLNQAEAIVGLRTELDAIAINVDTLGNDVTDLRRRLDALEGLTARMDEAEAAVDTLQGDLSVVQGEVSTLQEDSAALQQEVETISEDLTAITEDVDRATTFFERLRALIIEVFGEAPTSDE